MPRARIRITLAIIAAIAALLPRPAVRAQLPADTVVLSGAESPPGSTERIGQETSAASLEDLVESLGDDSFHRRRAASQSLLELAVPSGWDADSTVATALRSGLRHPALEVRLATDRLLQKIEQARFDDQLQQLLNPHIHSDAISIVGWKRFSQMAGHDLAARSLFARIATRHADLLHEIESIPRAGGKRTMPTRLSQLDPYRLASDDVRAWGLLLCCDAPGIEHGVANLSSRISMALSNSGLGPNITNQRDATVISRLVGHWLSLHGTCGSARERLLIAMRYRCHRRAGELCEQVFADPNSLPSSQVAAMLCALALGRSDLEPVLQQRLHDDRTAHVWQLIASRKTRIRTQVRDVALAIMLHQHQIDPRSVGYEELQADPLLIFRDHSLGFADQASREAAFTKAAQLMSDFGAIIQP